MSGRLLAMSVIISLFMTGHVTAQAWKRQPSLTETNANEDAIDVYYSPNLNKYCISIHSAKPTNSDQNNRIIYVPSDSHEKNYDMLLRLQKEYKAAPRFAEYGFYKYKKASIDKQQPIDSSNFLEGNNVGSKDQAAPSKEYDRADDVLTFGILVPLTSQGDELIRADSAVGERIGSIDTATYYLPPDASSGWMAFSVVEDDIEKTATFPRENLLPFLIMREHPIMRIENLKALVWLDHNGLPLNTVESVDAYSKADSLLLMMATWNMGEQYSAYYRYRSQFYLTLDRLFASYPDLYWREMPGVHLLRIDEKKNQVLIGFQAVSKVRLTPEGNRMEEALAGCSGGDWRPLADAEGNPYLFATVEADQMETSQSMKFPLVTEQLACLGGCLSACMPIMEILAAFSQIFGVFR